MLGGEEDGCSVWLLGGAPGPGSWRGSWADRSRTGEALAAAA